MLATAAVTRSSQLYSARLVSTSWRKNYVRDSVHVGRFEYARPPFYGLFIEMFNVREYKSRQFVFFRCAFSIHSAYAHALP